MTASRLVRGSKGRILGYFCIVVAFTGAVAVYHSLQTQLGNALQAHERCQKQQDSLSAQLQVIVDYKMRLEKSLQLEKSEHQKTRTELEERVKDEKSQRDRSSKEANSRFTSLQQHYKLLQSEHEDLKEESSRVQTQQLENINKLQEKIDQLSNQLNDITGSRDKRLEELKNLYVKLEVEKKDLQAQLGGNSDKITNSENTINHLTKVNRQLERQVEDLKNQCYLSKHHLVPSPQNLNIKTSKPASQQVQISPDVYEIRHKSKPSESKNVLDPPLNIESNGIGVLQKPDDAADVNDQKHGDAAVLQNPGNVHAEINAADESHVLQKPKNISSTPKTAVSKASLEMAKPLVVPTETKKPTAKNEQANDNSANVLPIPNIMAKKLPRGVVPIPANDEKNVADEINEALPNRYLNNIIEADMANEVIKETKPKAAPMDNAPDLNQENDAMEVVDAPKQAEDPLNVNVQNGFDFSEKKEHEKDPNIKHAENRQFVKQHIDALRLDDRKIHAQGARDGAFYDGAEYDKDGQREEEAEGEEDDDGDDYKGPVAERN